jgi:hypothetical protein
MTRRAHGGTCTSGGPKGAFNTLTSRLIDISTDSPVVGLLPVMEWLPQQTCVQVAWVPELRPPQFELTPT